MTRTRKQAKIKLGCELIALEVAARMGCSRASVYNALAYKSNSERAIKIRKIALAEYGGVEVMDTIIER